MKSRAGIILIFSVIIVIFLFYTIHGTPERAVRTAIFGTGDFSRAFSCDITELDSSNSKKTYKVSPPYYEEATGTIVDEYVVEKSRFNYYIAGYYFNN